MTVAWTPNGSAGHLEIVISVGVDQNTAVQAVCEAPVSAGTFTIPNYVLLALPPTNNANFYFQPGDLNPAYSNTFSANGLTFGIARSFVDGIRFGGLTLN